MRPPSAASFSRSFALSSAALVLSLLAGCECARKGQTEGGNSNGAPCRFPFIYNGLSYNSCIDREHTQPWCATTANFDIDKRWGNCQAEDLATVPRFNSMSKNVTAFVGDTVRLPCSVNKLGQRAIVWSKKNEDFPLTVKTSVYTTDERVNLDYKEDGDVTEWTLVIDRLLKTDEGSYSCRVTIRTLLLEHVVLLAVLDRPPPKLPFVTLGDVTSMAIGKGLPFHLQCNATASEDSLPRAMQMPPEVEWFKDGNKVNSAAISGILITNQIVGRLRISMLFVDKSTMEDGGVYLCRTSEETFAEIRVHILNTDKDNKKRGTVLEKPASEKLIVSKVNSGAARETAWSMLLATCYALSLL